MRPFFYVRTSLVIKIHLWLIYFQLIANLYHIHTQKRGGGVKIITRAEAAKAGIMKYYTGAACRNGHVCERYTVNGACVECNAIHTKAQRQRVREMITLARESREVTHA